MALDVRQQEARIDGVLDHRYKVRREIARGGHGAVFEAEHLVTRARVAIKTLNRAALEIPAARLRLIREARVLGVMRHPNLISVYDAGTCPLFGPYLVLEMIEGRPLDGVLLARQKLPVSQALAIALELCAALSEAHRHGIVHRDVKPSNILIERTLSGDRVELIDFGIAKVGDEAEDSADKLTKAGELLGTVDYMAPEQIMSSAPTDARSDVYAVGVVLYECLAGEVPRSGAPTTVIANMLAGTKIAPLHARRDDVSPEIDAAICKALEIDPARRHGSAEALANACLAAYGSSVPKLDLLRGSDEAGSPPGHAAPSSLRAAGATSELEGPAARRQYARAPYVTPVRVLLSHGSTDGRTEDLSEGGLLMITEAGCTDGERVRLRLPLPVSGRIVELEAITRWVKTRRNQRAIGAEFVALSEDVRAEIRAYIALMSGKRGSAPIVT